jgi:4-diphosphocytidyl-2-C-methyl-D-erythritol kinase
MVCFPNAKINIGLNITEKRSDGFHNLESVFYPVGLCDVLEVIENGNTSEQICLQSSGISIPGDFSGNSCVKAYHLISRDYPLPRVKVHLHKIIPIGSGLGGGSSDAAFFIKLLNDKFEIGLSWGEMHNYARQTGSDCSFFINNRPAYAIGKGDQYETFQYSLKGYWVVLIYPNIHIKTADAYLHVSPKMSVSSLEDDVLTLPVEKWKNVIKNDFEESVFNQYPLIGTIKQELYDAGAVYASLSGSGSCLFGLFGRRIIPENKFRDYFVWQEALCQVRTKLKYALHLLIIKIFRTKGPLL